MPITPKPGVRARPLKPRPLSAISRRSGPRLARRATARRRSRARACARWSALRSRCAAALPVGGGQRDAAAVPDVDADAGLRGEGPRQGVERFRQRSARPRNAARASSRALVHAAARQRPARAAAGRGPASRVGQRRRAPLRCGARWRSGAAPACRGSRARGGRALPCARPERSRPPAARVRSPRRPATRSSTSRSSSRRVSLRHAGAAMFMMPSGRSAK